MKEPFVAVLFLAGTLLAQVSRPDLTIRHVTLITPTPIDFSERQQIIHAIKAFKQERAPVGDLSELYRDIARDQFQQRGYFKADVPNPEIRIVEINQQREIIDLIVDVTPGDKYRLGEISFENERAFPLSQLRHQFPIADGNSFDILKMRTGLENLRKLYLAQGYINFIAVPNTTLNDVAHTISIQIDADEGHIYRIGELILDGDEWRPGTKTKLQRDWQKYVGKPYSPPVLNEFLREEHASSRVNPELLFSIRTKNSTSSITEPDQPPYTVDVRLVLANPTACLPAPEEQTIHKCWLAGAESLPRH